MCVSHQISLRGGADGHGYKAHLRQFSRRDRQYVEEPEEAQRSRHARLGLRNRKTVRNAGKRSAHTHGRVGRYSIILPVTAHFQLRAWQ